MGYQRSGTTLLQALLGAHPRIAAPPETYFVFRIADLADYYGDLADEAKLRRALHDMLDLSLLADCGFEEDRLFDRLVEGERSYAALFDVMMKDFAERHGKLRWSDKTPGQPAGRVLQLFPEAQIVHIVRDPRDVIASSLRTPWTTLDAAELAESWRSFTLNNAQIGRSVGSSAFHQIRYEDLTRDPEGVLRGICEFLGESYDPKAISDPSRRRHTIAPLAAPWQLKALEGIVPRKAGEWRERLSRVEAARVSAIVRREIIQFGYEPPSSASVIAGRLLRFDSPWRSLARRREGRRIARLVSDPVARHREIGRFMREQAQRVGWTEKHRTL